MIALAPRNVSSVFGIAFGRLSLATHSGRKSRSTFDLVRDRISRRLCNWRSRSVLNGSMIYSARSGGVADRRDNGWRSTEETPFAPHGIVRLTIERQVSTKGQKRRALTSSPIEAYDETDDQPDRLSSQGADCSRRRGHSERLAQRRVRRPITPGSLLLEELALDSLDLVAVILQIQDHFGVEIDPDEIPNLRSVDDLVTSVKNQLQAAA